MDIIQLLPDHVANQIAAGEVIQRPSSVIKETLENSLDSGASEIQLYIKDAGKTLIHIVDNGCGMNSNDVVKCFVRHATSKIQKADDLFAIQTMGFRGEAMASIAAISHIELETKLIQEELGTKIIIEGGEVISKNDHSSIDGTSIKIKNLFYNIPARRKFLKSDNVEMRHITEEFIRIALSHPECKMQLFHNNKEIYFLPKNKFRQRIVNVIGLRSNERLVPIIEITSLIEINGFICKPEYAKRTRGEQYIFVNKRFIKNYHIQSAISKAFEGLISPNHHPSYFINLTVDATSIDVNIHPTKTEIKFEDEKSIYAIIRSTVKRSLGQYNISPSIDFLQENSFNVNLDEKNIAIREPKINIDPLYNPFNESQETIKDSQQINSQIELINDTKSEIISSFTQLNKKYILKIDETAIFIIHQRRAHKRILYEFYLNACKQLNNETQKLLFPNKITVSIQDFKIIEELQNDLQKVGFVFNLEQENNIYFEGIPVNCKQENIKCILEDIIEQYKNSHDTNLDKDDRLALSLSNSMAISEQKLLNKDEMTQLNHELMKCEQPSFSPKGKPIIANFNNQDIDKIFK